MFRSSRGTGSPCSEPQVIVPFSFGRGGRDLLRVCFAENGPIFWCWTGFVRHYLLMARQDSAFTDTLPIYSNQVKPLNWSQWAKRPRSRFAMTTYEYSIGRLWFSTVLSGLPFSSPSEGRPRMSDVSLLSGISGLSFDSTLLLCLVLLPFLSYLFLSAGQFF